MSNEQNWPAGIIFDLDGTLVHSAPDLATALNLVLDMEGQKPLEVDEVALMIGAGVPKLIERGFTARGITLDQAKLDALTKPFLEYYDAHATDLTKLYDGAEEILKHYADSPIKTAICTNKPTEAARIILADLGVADYFDVIMGGSSGFPKKPDPQVVHACMKEMGVDTTNCIYVGDSETDVLTARNSELPILVVPYGYTAAKPEDLKADGVIQNLMEIPQGIEALRAKA